MVFASDVVAEDVGDGGNGGKAVMGGAGAAPHAYLAVSVAGEEAVFGDSEGTDGSGSLVGLELGELGEVGEPPDANGAGLGARVEEWTGESDG